MKYARLIILIFLLAGCGRGTPESDAFGNFEADEVVVSSEASGTLLRYGAAEGKRLSAGEVVAVVDTTQLVLQRETLRAQRMAAAARIGSVRAQMEVIEEKIQIAARERQRFENLVRHDAAPAKQLDDAADQVRVLEKEAATIRSQIGTVASEIEAIDAQIAQTNYRIARSVIRNPVGGVVLTSYAAEGELATTGRPLYEIADIDTLFLKAFVSGGQLPQVRLGQRVEVLVDTDADTMRALQGAVSWIASEAEFTPKLIQTREERVHLVYALKVRVPNADGMLKIGMPGEVRLPEE